MLEIELILYYEMRSNQEVGYDDCVGLIVCTQYKAGTLKETDWWVRICACLGLWTSTYGK